MSKPNEKKLRVFEAFAGIGAQAAALKRMNINYEIVGISDWFIDAIECYAAIHCGDKEVIVPEDIAEVDEYLAQFTFSADSVKPYNIKRLTEDQRRDLYRANKKANNYGSITELKGCDMPDTDLLVYSFPCQDLSTGGKGKGMSKGSGTRSGLLWEIERILKELHELDRLPEYLLLENVKTIKAETNLKDLNQWLSFLESIGYKNDECMILNSLDFGVPQDRERAFIISHLGAKLDLREQISNKKKPRNFNIHEFILTDYDSDPALRTEADMAQLNKTKSRDVMWDINGIEPIKSDTTVRTITCNMDRTHTAALFKYKGIKGDTYRRLTLREAFLLMGFSKDEYLKAKSLGFSYRKLNKLIGNSIIKELKNRKIIRTKNVTGDLAEYLAIQHYCKTPGLPNLQAAPIGTQNIDAISRAGDRYSIKAVSGNVTGTFHGLNPKGSSDPDAQKFEYVIICKFDDELHIEAIYELTWDAFIKHKKWHSTMKAWNISLTKKVIADAKLIYAALSK